MSHFPELITGRSDIAPGRWIVREGGVQRGSASCNIGERILEIPFGHDGVSRAVRLHEFMHARVSPFFTDSCVLPPDISLRALECAEELRVNTLLGRLGVDVSLLCDCSERRGAELLAQAGAWSEAMVFFAAVIGTGAEKPFLAGIRRHRPEWSASLRAVRRRLSVILDGCTTATATDTSLGSSGLPRGYEVMTLPLARVLTRAMSARPPRNGDEQKAFRRALEPGGRRPATGAFAPLRWREEPVDGGARRTPVVRRWRPGTSGPTLRYPSRLLTDPARRAFALRGRGRGGVIVIDQSGSMDLSADELASILSKAPDATIVGYSHRPGDESGAPNVWMIARPGRPGIALVDGNIGNGVDGPALEWAVRNRQPGEPVVWVTDGQVTDSNDHPDPALAKACAALVRRYGIRVVRSLSEAGPALRTPPRPQWSQFGRMGKYMGTPGK